MQPAQGEAGAARPRRRRRAVHAGAVAAVMTALAALGAAPARAEPAPTTTAGAPVPVGRAGARQTAVVPRLVWTDCGAAYQCATARVPLDWSRPRGGTVTLALAKLPATRPGARIGTVFVNPGGPGASGVDAVRAAPDLLPEGVRARFDVVGFDPRFVGASQPAASCLNDGAYAAFVDAQPPFPLTPEAEPAFAAAHAGYTAQCTRQSLLRFASTASVARDLDLLRQAVGDEALSYVGYSYGTYLGQVYAQLFGNRVRAMVLDGVLDGRAWQSGTGQERLTTPFSVRVGSAEASQEALGEFFRLCADVGSARCALDSQGDPAATYAAIADSLAAQPLQLDADTQLDYQRLVTVTSSVLYAPGYWQAFAADLQLLHVELGDAAPAAAAAARRPRTTRTAAAVARRLVARAEQIDDLPGMPTLRMPALLPGDLPGRIPAGPVGYPTPADNAFAAFAAVSCTDTANPSDLSVWSRAAADTMGRSPYFGRAWTWSGLVCATWPHQDPGAYRGPIGAQLGAPLLVIGTRFDPATPYQGAVVTAQRYPGSRLLTVEGYGHTSSAMPSRCVSSAITEYLVRTAAPRESVCRQDLEPFPS